MDSLSQLGVSEPANFSSSASGASPGVNNSKPSSAASVGPVAPSVAPIMPANFDYKEALYDMGNDAWMQLGDVVVTGAHQNEQHAPVPPHRAGLPPVLVTAEEGEGDAQQREGTQVDGSTAPPGFSLFQFPVMRSLSLPTGDLPLLVGVEESADGAPLAGGSSAAERDQERGYCLFSRGGGELSPGVGFGTLSVPVK